jgi:hypothetical protein
MKKCSSSALKFFYWGATCLSIHRSLVAAAATSAVSGGHFATEDHWFLLPIKCMCGCSDLECFDDSAGW